MRYLAAITLLVLITSGCKKVEKTETIGHQGKARLNPYLAAERLLESSGESVPRQYGWPNFDEEEISTVIIPASALTAEGYVRDLEEWVYWMGHAIILLEGGEFFVNDWSEYQSRHTEFSEPLTDWLDREGLSLVEGDGDSDKHSTQSVTFNEQDYEVWMESHSHAQSSDDSSPASFISIPSGDGRITLVADARPFRNRHIGDYDHAPLLLDLVESTPYQGSVVFVRNVSLSFWGLLWSRGWPAMIPLVLLVAFWLWKNIPRFQPLDHTQAPDLARSQTHHLAAIGGFHWKLDHGRYLLTPLRESLRERTHALMVSSGQADADIFEVMATRAEIPRERAQRAMTDEQSSDPGAFTRIVADLQLIHQAIS